MSRKPPTKYGEYSTIPPLKTRPLQIFPDSNRRTHHTPVGAGHVEDENGGGKHPHPDDVPACPTTSHASIASPKSVQPAVFGLDVWDIPTLNIAEQQMGKQAGMVGIYQDWAHQVGFPLSTARKITNRGSVPLIAWEPWNSWKPANSQPEYDPRLITAGRYNALIDQWLMGAKKFNKPVLVHFAPEMNGDWHVWSPNPRTNSLRAADYVAMWRCVVNRAHKSKVTNIKWVWNPIVKSGESTPMRTMFPGTSYVDWVGVDGFNWVPCDRGVGSPMRTSSLQASLNSNASPPTNRGSSLRPAVCRVQEPSKGCG